MKRIHLLFSQALLMIVTILAVSCVKAPEEILLDHTIIALNVGDTQKITASFAKREINPSEIKWKNSNEAIVKVSDDGTVTALSPGVAVITARILGEVSGNCIVRVSTPDAFTILTSEIRSNSFFFKDGITYRIIDASNADIYYIVRLPAIKPSKKIGFILPQVTEVKYMTFKSCEALSSISLPNAHTIDLNAFESCDQLVSVNLPVVFAIRRNAFSGCSGLATIDLPAVFTIEENAFSLCTELSYITLPKATIIGGEAFKGCTKLTALDLPAATSIGWEIFRSCPELTTLKLGASTPITTDRSFDGLATENVNLYLGTGEINNAVGNQWKELTWKSISPY